MPLLDIPAALMAGCAVLSKPSEFTPLAWRVEGWKQIGTPMCWTWFSVTAKPVRHWSIRSTT